MSCRQFLSSSGCPYGSRCCFAHVRPERSQGLCHQFVSPAGCPFGDTCRFQHPAQLPPAVVTPPPPGQATQQAPPVQNAVQVETSSPTAWGLAYSTEGYGPLVKLIQNPSPQTVRLQYDAFERKLSIFELTSNASNGPEWWASWFDRQLQQVLTSASEVKVVVGGKVECTLAQGLTLTEAALAKSTPVVSTAGQSDNVMDTGSRGARVKFVAFSRRESGRNMADYIRSAVTWARDLRVASENPGRIQGTVAVTDPDIGPLLRQVFPSVIVEYEEFLRSPAMASRQEANAVYPEGEMKAFFYHIKTLLAVSHSRSNVEMLTLRGDAHSDVAVVIKSSDRSIVRAAYSKMLPLFTSEFRFQAGDAIGQETLRRVRDQHHIVAHLPLMIEWKKSENGDLLANIFGLPNPAAAFAKICWDIHTKISAHCMFGRLATPCRELIMNPAFDAAMAQLIGDGALRIDGAEVAVFADVTDHKDPLIVCRAVDDCLRQLLGAGGDVDVPCLQLNACVECGNAQSHCRQLHACGHTMCMNCLRRRGTQSGVFPIRCAAPNCGTPLLGLDMMPSIDASGKERDKMLAVIAKHQLTFAEHHAQACDNCDEGVLFVTDPTELISRCSQCYNSKCVACGLDGSIHKTMTCDEARRFLESLGDQSHLVADARRFVADNWVGMPTIQQITVNPFFGDPESNCVKSFRAGLADAGPGALAPEGQFFAWHGTPTAAGILGICQENLDVRRRNGQVYGQGEYFGWTPQVSQGYCGSTTSVIVFAILKGRWVSRSTGFCYVVDNPSNNLMYHIPVLVVRFGCGSESVVNWPKAVGSIAEEEQDDDQVRPVGPLDPLLSPFSFAWEDDYHALKDYGRGDQVILGEAYASTPLTSVALSTHPYVVDLASMTQTNTVTGFQRQVRRRLTALTARTYRFQYTDGPKWRDLHDMLQGTLNQHYEGYRNGTSSAAVFAVGLDEVGGAYEVDLVHETITPLATNAAPCAGAPATQARLRQL